MTTIIHATYCATETSSRRSTRTRTRTTVCEHTLELFEDREKFLAIIEAARHEIYPPAPALAKPKTIHEQYVVSGLGGMQASYPPPPAVDVFLCRCELQLEHAGARMARPVLAVELEHTDHRGRDHRCLLIGIRSIDVARWNDPVRIVGVNYHRPDEERSGPVSASTGISLLLRGWLHD